MGQRGRRSAIRIRTLVLVKSNPNLTAVLSLIGAIWAIFLGFSQRGLLHPAEFFAAWILLLASLFTHVKLPWLNASFGFYNPLIFCYVLFWGKASTIPVLAAFLVFFLIHRLPLARLISNVGRYVLVTGATAWLYGILGGKVNFVSLSTDMGIPILVTVFFHNILDFVSFALSHFGLNGEIPDARRVAAGYALELPFYLVVPFIPPARHVLPDAMFLLVPLFFLVAVSVFKFGLKAHVEMGKLQTVYDLSKILSASLNLSALLPELCRNLDEKLNTKGTAVFLRDGEILRKVAATGVFSLPTVGDPINPDLLPELGVATVCTLESKPGLFHETLFPLALLPLKSKDDLMGCLFISRPIVHDEQEKLLGILAAQISSAVKNSFLYEETVRAHENLKAVQAQLIQASKLAAVGQLAAGIAHEINNPLGAILLNAASLVKNPGDREAAEIVMDASTRCKGIVERLLHFARQARGERRQLPLSESAREALRLWEKQLKLDHISVRLESSGNPVIEGEPQELVQVISNLLANARDAILDKKESPGEIRIRCLDEGHAAILEVSDNGTGIPESVLPRIFDPFFTTKEVGKGTGLGLSVSYGIIQGMQGSIQVENHPGAGATFRVIFPKASPSRASVIDQALERL